MKKLFLISLLPLLAFAAVRWQVLRSEHYNLVYPKGYDFQAQRAVDWLEILRPKVNNLVGYDPGKVWIVIEDMGMTVNGFSNPIGNEIHLFTTPPSGLDLSTQDWIRTVAIHEYAHEVSLSSVWGLPKALGILLGPWVIPNMVTPGWMIEGVTVYTESHLLPYEGRLQAGEFDANLLTRAAQGVKTTRTWNMEGAIFEYPMGAIYAYGGPFFEWLTEEKGDTAIARFYRLHGSRIPLFSFDRSAREAFGESFPFLIHDWKQSVAERAKDYIPADSAARKLTSDGWYISGSAVTDGKLVYYSRTYGRKPAALYTKFYFDITSLDPATGDVKVLKRPNTNVGLPLRVHDDVLYYAATVTARGFPNTSGSSFGELNELRALDLGTHKETKLYKGRLRAFDRMPDGSFLISLDKENAEFGSRLVQLDPALGGAPFELYSGDLLVGEIVISDKGEVFCTARHQGENWDIYRFSYPDQTWTQLTRTPWAESGLSVAPDGGVLYSANPYGTDGRAGCYRLDPNTGSVEEFNVPSYTLNPLLVGSELVFTGMNPKGNDLYSVIPEAVTASFPAITDAPVLEPSYSGGYEKRSSCSPYLTLLRPWLRVPYFDFKYSNDTGLTHLNLGAFLMGSDVITENSYNLIAYYDVIGEAPSVDFSWENAIFAPLNLYLDFNLTPVWSPNHNLSGYTYNLYPYFWYPVVSNQGKGLTNLFWGEGFRFNGDSLQNRHISSSLLGNFSWPYFRMGGSVTHSWESPIFSSSESSILYLRASGTLDLVGGLLIGDVSTRIDLSLDKLPSYGYSSPIRGYKDTILTTTDPFFQTATLEYRHRLLKMRFGIWNPNVFFEDLYVTLFADACYDTHEILGASVGALVTPEIRLFWNFIPLAPSVGVALTRELEPVFLFEFNTDFPYSIKKNSRDPLDFICDPRADARKFLLE